MADHLGSASLTTDSSGSVVSRQLYDAWGNVRTSASIGQMPTDIGYTGQRLDTTGLMFYGARYYSRAGAFHLCGYDVVVSGKSPKPESLFVYQK